MVLAVCVCVCGGAVMVGVLVPELAWPLTRPGGGPKVSASTVLM